MGENDGLEGRDCLVDQQEDGLSDEINTTAEMFWDIVDPGWSSLDHDPVAMWRREQYD